MIKVGSLVKLLWRFSEPCFGIVIETREHLRGNGHFRILVEEEIHTCWEFEVEKVTA